MPLKLITLVGTRPEIIKLSRVMSELDSYTKHILVHSGQNYDYELNEIFFQELEIRKPDYFLNAAGKNSSQTISNVIRKFDKVLEAESPGAVLILGDTNSCLGAISAKRRQIPIFHMEAGNRCFDQRVPEEINRKIIDHISDINLPYTEHARRYLLNEGIRPETVIKTGSPMKEVIGYYKEKILASTILDELGLSKDNYILFSAHREENVDNKSNLKKIMETLNLLDSELKRKIIVSTHPRTQKKLQKNKSLEFSSGISFLKPFGFLDYVKLEMNAFCVVSDSGTITEESSILNIPAVTIRNAHERPEGMDQGTLIMCGLEPEKVVDAVKAVKDQYTNNRRPFEIAPDYNIENVSKKIIRIILSYTDYVNRFVWHKY